LVTSSAATARNSKAAPNSKAVCHAAHRGQSRLCLCTGDVKRGRCVHTWLVFLFLSPAFLNWSHFKRLAHGKSTAEDSESDQSDSDDESKPANDHVRNWMAAYAYDTYRYQEEDSVSRDKDKNWKPTCTDSKCDKKDGTCEHVFPRVFRPPADLKMCPCCSKCKAMLFVQYCTEKGELIETTIFRKATLYADRDIIEDVQIYTKNCLQCFAVFYPYPKDQGFFVYSHSCLQLLVRHFLLFPSSVIHAGDVVANSTGFGIRHCTNGSHRHLENRN